MNVLNRIVVSDTELAEICQRYHVRELALFGSVLRDDFRDDSDIDVLVEFEPDAPIGLFELVAMRRELADLIGRDVDLVEKAGLKQVIREPVLRSAETIYAA